MLCAGGRVVLLRLIAEFMAEQGLRSCQLCSYKRTTLACEQLEAIPDCLQRDFIAGVPGIRLVGHVTLWGSSHLSGLLLVDLDRG